MFANLLPGFRDFRTPLAVGLLWMATVWVWFGQHIPNEAAATGLIAQVYRLTGVLGTAAILAMLTFGGYVLGLLLSSLHLDWPFIRRRLPRPLAVLSAQSRDQIYNRYVEAMDRARAAGVSEQAQRNWVEQTHPDSLSGIQDDIAQMAMRLQGTQKDIYDDYDRPHSEAEFRRSIALPLGLLIGSVASAMVPGQWLLVVAWVVALLVFLALHMLSWRKTREGNDLVLQSLLSGQVQSPAVEALDALTERMPERRGRRMR